MLRFALLSVCVVLVTSQQNYNHNPQNAAIISEARYLAGNQFGATYDTEDGTNFKEETDADGTRHGSYSYIDPTGQKRTISYTAGKNGFQASGDHLPVAPAAPPHAQQAVHAAQNQPQFRAQPQQQLHSQQQFQQPQQFSSSADNFDDGQYDPRYNDPSFSPNTNNHFAAAPLQNRASAPIHFNPAPIQQQQQQQQFIPQQQQQFNHVPQYTTTPNPHRFQPPGKLNLNRTPDGFSYSFNKV